MIGSQYKAHKKNVIDLFNGYKEKRGDLNDGIDIDFWEKRIESLKTGKYTLAVAGDVKAGKSTFINALLGTELLPADVLQSSSAIVEIFKSEKSFLRVKYADGKEEEVYDDLSTLDIDEAKERLLEICRIRDKYREIPTTLLDEYIIKSSTFVEVTDSLTKEWQIQSKTNLSGKEELLKQYIGERTKDKIPVEIDFGYPLKWDFDELRIVDSPGVNAVGGVQDVSFRFFEEANAIIFVHPIKPVESESLKELVRFVISDRSKETLFLVLTHTGLETDSDIERLYTEAVRLYKEYIPEERILAVDSLLKLIHNDIEDGKTLEQIEESSERKSDLLPKFEKKAKRKNQKLQDVLLEYSRFEKMFEAIDRFSMHAPNLQLQEIIEFIKKSYEDQNSKYEETLELLKTKKKNPQEFEAEINRIHNALSKYKNIILTTKEDLTSNYLGFDTEWLKSLDKITAKFHKLILESNTLELVRKSGTDVFNEIEDLINIFSSSITKELRERLEKEGKIFQEEHKITVPKVDLKSIETKAKNDAYREEDVHESREADVWDYAGFGIPLIFRSKEVVTGTKRVYDKKSHLKLFKDKCLEDVETRIKEFDFNKRTGDYTKSCLESFTKEMNCAIENRQKELKKEKEKKQSNDEIIVEIDNLKVKKKENQPELKRVEAILEDIK